MAFVFAGAKTQEELEQLFEMTDLVEGMVTNRIVNLLYTIPYPVRIHHGRIKMNGKEIARIYIYDNDKVTVWSKINGKCFSVPVYFDGDGDLFDDEKAAQAADWLSRQLEGAA